MSTADKRSRGVRSRGVHIRGVHILGLAFALLFILLSIAAFIAFRFHSTPEHWEQEQARLAALSDSQQQATSQSFRNQFITLWGNPGDKTHPTDADLFGHRQPIKVPYAELNTWIKAEGAAMLSDFGVKVPKSATSLMVDSPGDELLRVSFEIAYKGTPQIISLSFKVQIASDGTLTSTLKQATAGKQPLPVGTAIDLVASKAGGGVTLDLMKGNPIPPIQVPIDPGEDGLRDGRLVGLQVFDDALIITRQTVRRKKK